MVLADQIVIRDRLLISPGCESIVVRKIKIRGNFDLAGSNFLRKYIHVLQHISRRICSIVFVIRHADTVFQDSVSLDNAKGKLALYITIQGVNNGFVNLLLHRSDDNVGNIRIFGSLVNSPHIAVHADGINAFLKTASAI